MAVDYVKEGRIAILTINHPEAWKELELSPRKDPPDTRQDEEGRSCNIA